MMNRSKRRRIALTAALTGAILFAPACASYHGSGRYGSCNTYWYEDVGVALVAAAFFVVAACSGGHGHYSGSYGGHYGHGGYHSGWHSR